jgi:Mo25-like
VANSNKVPDFAKILRENKVKLCRYLATLHQDNEASDTQFRNEKALVIATIDELSLTYKCDLTF